MPYGICPSCGGTTKHAGELCWDCELHQAESAEDFDQDELGIDPEEE